MPRFQILDVGERDQAAEPLRRATGHRFGQVPDVVAEVHARMDRLIARLEYRYSFVSKLGIR